MEINHTIASPSILMEDWRQDSNNEPVGNRIAVIGSTGSGKTTLACRLSQRLRLKHVELDSLHWETDWTSAPRDIFRHRVDEALTGERWVVDGNYSATRDIIWPRADTIVWLDYSFPLIFRRLLSRTIRRSVSRELLWGKNRERLRIQFLSRESLLLYAIKIYRKRRIKYRAQLAQPFTEHLIKVHTKSPEETRIWFNRLPQIPSMSQS